MINYIQIYYKAKNYFQNIFFGIYTFALFIICSEIISSFVIIFTIVESVINIIVLYSEIKNLSREEIFVEQEFKLLLVNNALRNKIYSVVLKSFIIFFTL